MVVGVGGQEAFVERGGGDHADRENGAAERAEAPGGERGEQAEGEDEQNGICPDRHPENAVAKRVAGEVAVNLAEAAEIPREAGIPVDFAAFRGVVHVGEADAPLAILEKFFGMAVPDIAVERDLEQGNGKDLGGLGVRAVHLAAEALGDLIDQVGVEEDIADAGEKDGREAAPGEDARESGGRNGGGLGLRRIGCGAVFLFLGGGHGELCAPVRRQRIRATGSAR